MKLFNLMFGKKLGGLEQAALDYHEALKHGGHDVTTLLRQGADMWPRFIDANFQTIAMSPKGEWDVFAKHKLRQLARNNEPDAVIAHGNRAIGLAIKAFKKRIPVIGVAHNYHIKKRFPKCDAVFCITRDLIEEMVHLDMPRDKLFHIPNLIRVQQTEPRTAFHEPFTIGTLGRFVEKKGMDILLQAVQALRQQDLNVNTIIGGDGPLALQLQHQAEQLGIADCVSFPGWIEDKQRFFESLDLFVLPSHHEPFGIVLIEAMAAGLPCITTDTEGPCEIIRQNVDAIMIEKAQPYQMAQMIRELIDSPERAFAMGAAAHIKARERYDISVVSEQLSLVLKQVLA